MPTLAEVQQRAGTVVVSLARFIRTRPAAVTFGFGAAMVLGSLLIAWCSR